MPLSDIRTWLKFATQQMAAESYLDEINLSSRNEVKNQLLLGNNHPLLDPSLSGKTRFTDQLADQFLDSYQILDHHANDASGFSATLMRDTTTGEYTLSFRSTEPRPATEGGDAERDGLFADGLTPAADGEIGLSGFAFGQLIAMERYYLELTTSGTLPAGATLNVTGYSLGGHLATVFTELHASDVAGTYVFNASGRGRIDGFSGTDAATLAAEAQQIDALLFRFMTILFDPQAGVMQPSDEELAAFQFAREAHLANPTWNPFTSGSTENLYVDPRYRWAKQVTLTEFDTVGTAELEIRTGLSGIQVTGGAFAKITQIFGDAAFGDDTLVALSGLSAGPIQSVLIEGQPLLPGTIIPRLSDAGSSHSITLIVDSLAVQELIQTVDPAYRQAGAELLIRAASNKRAIDTLTQERAEGDSLEKTVDAFRKLLLGPTLPDPNPLNVDFAVGGFANFAFRNEMYTAMAAIQQAVDTQQAQGVVFTIADLTNPTVSSPAIAGIADTDTDHGLAYRYALKELNPFAVVATTSQANDALYAAHNDQGQLDRFDAGTGTGTMTTQYLIDRALFLAEKVALNQLDQDTSSRTIHFQDVASTYEIKTPLTLAFAQREFLFGSDDLDTLTGGSKDDHLYGGGSVDVLIGNGGRDYLEGNGGSDRLEGGAGADTLVGGAGNDTYLVDDLGDQVIEIGDNGTTDTVESSVTFSLVDTTVEDLTLTGTNDINGTGNELDNLITGNNGINRLDGKAGTDHLVGGLGNDILLGGAGDNDLLEGGAGFDTYIYNNGDGIDQIEDSDATGKIVFNGGLLQGGISTDGGATYVSLDGTETYVLSGGHLIVNGVLTVNADFQSGQFGIELNDLSSYPTDPGVPTGHSIVRIGTDNIEFDTTGGPPTALFGNGGDDELVGDNLPPIGSSGDLLDGGAGDDMLFGGDGNDYLVGGEGNDYAELTPGDVFIGGLGNDIMTAYTDNTIAFNNPVAASGPINGSHYADGGAGDDMLFGALGVDVLRGGEGNDLVRGENRPAGWLLRVLSPVTNWWAGYVSQPALMRVSGSGDLLYGDAGNDVLVGDGGHDVLSGGADNDQLYGDDFAEDQILYFVQPGDDVLDGGAGDDLLAAGDGSDSLAGGSGIDTLFGDKGNDVLDGGDDADTLRGGDGADELFGGGGHDLLFGDGLNNQFVAGTVGGADVLDGGDGNDELQGGLGNDTLYGGAGDDLLFGQEDDDVLFGDDGNDGLVGGLGNDLLSGDAGDDILNGDEGNDTVVGGDGHDSMTGNDGNDTLVGGTGNDTLQGDHGDDVLVGGAGNDIYNFFVGDGHDTITDSALAGEGNVINFFPGITLDSLTFVHDQAQQTLTIQIGSGSDSIRLLGFDPNTFSYVVNTLRFADGSFVGLADQLPLPGGVVEGTDESNVIRTGSGDDTVFAGNGNDFVDAGAGNDQLIGGSGNDTLLGGAGQDTYVINPGDGVDTITEATGEGNRLVFGAGVSANALTLATAPGGTLVINYGAIGNQVRLASSLVTLPTIDTFEFADGTTLSFAELVSRGIALVGTAGNDVIAAPDDRRYIIQGLDGHDVLTGASDHDTLEGGAGSDTLIGQAGNDVLDGGLGDDQLVGGEGADLYRFNLGDGLDNIADSNVAGEESRVVFGPGITSSSTTLTTRSGQVVVRPSAADEGLLIGVNGSDALGPRAVDLFEFADGSSITYADLVARGFDIDGTPFDDQLFGTNVVDRITGGAGNDQLEGGEGDDRYFYNQDDGIDTINDQAVTGAGNAVVFGTGIASDAVQAKLVNHPFDPSLSSLLLEAGGNGEGIRIDTFDPKDALGPHPVEQFQFADGTTLTYGQLLDRGIEISGTAGNDALKGTNVNDRLDGGAGNDELRGDEGNDVYLFGRGSGQDVAIDRQGNLDAVRVAADVAPSDVTVTRIGQDLVLGIVGATDQLTLSLFLLAPTLQIEQVQFADGTVWDTVMLTTLAQPTTTGTAGPDTLVGTPNGDRLAGLAGDDQLTGLAGHDLLDGGTGIDQLAGGLGDDTYLVDDAGDVVTEAANEGLDTIQSSVSRSLEANVENLTLAGAATINATGNALDNILTGNSGANVLAGGAGNDTYVAGPEDTVVEVANEGIDTVLSAVSTQLSPNVENLTVTGSASISGTGNELDNVLQADGSISTLAGGTGDDTYIQGFNGDDDVLIETATGGIDTAIAAQDYRLPAHIENLTLLDPRVPDFATFSLLPFRSSGTSVSGFGNDLNNTLIGGQANNLLDGGLGADTMLGGAGDDTYDVNHAADVVIEQANEGTDIVHSSVSYTLGANVENLTLIGVDPGNATGNALNNDVRGNEAPNVLDGGAGNDSLQGSGGADTYLFGRGSGQDFLFDTSMAGEIETIQLAADVALADVEVYRRDFNLVLVIAGTTDELTVFGFYDQPAYAQKQVRFADGTVWNEAELRARAVTVGGTSAGTGENETLTGGVGHDTLIGNAGDDILVGGLGGDTIYGDATTPSSSTTGHPITGNDVLRGGPGGDLLLDFHGTNLFDAGSGNDSLFLGSGQDTVLFGRGSGIDSVHFDGNGSDVDMIELAAELAPSDVILTRQYPNSHVLDLTIRDTGDRLTINLSTNFPSVGGNTVQGKIVFSNGTQWDLTWSPAEPPVGSIGDDILQSSFPTTLTGLSGDDTYLIGGSGVPGTYTVIESSGGGIDTVQTLVPYTLDTDVENLILAESRSSATPNLAHGVGNELDNLIIGNTADNVLDGGAGNDVLVGGLFRSFEGASVIVGTGSDILIGGAGDDILMADGGNISLPTVGFDGSWLFIGGGSQFPETVPRRADDVFIGGTGNDTYILHNQLQTVTEFANEGTDTVRSTVSYTLGEHVENLVLVDPVPVFDNNDDLVPPPPLHGTGNELDNLLIGSAKANTMTGGAGNDTLWGGSAIDPESGEPASGNDTLLGGVGHDTYLFNLGDGADTIEDTAITGEGNRIQFGAGITQADLTFTRDETARTLTIQVGSSGTDQLLLANFDPTSANGSLVVETLVFADGSQASLAALLGLGGPVATNGDDTITTGAGDDVVDALGGNDTVNTGAGNDTITGGTGNDQLTGGTGNDTYIFNAGDGVDTITDTSLPGEGNTVEFGADITPVDVSLGVGSLLIRVGTNGDAIHLTNFDPTNVLGPRTIESFRFADGSVLSHDQLIARGFDLTGTAANDTITGTNVVDRINGLAGDDTIQGGTGDDQLSGGAGSDTYQFNLGDGIDRIEDVAGPGEGNRIQFGAGVSQAGLTFTRDHAARTLTIDVGGSGMDKLVLTNFDPNGTDGSHVMETLAFADGSIVNMVDLYPPNHAPTVAVPLADQTMPEDAPFSITILTTTFADPDANDVLTYSASLADGTALPAWLTFDGATRTFTGTPDDAQVGIVNLRVTATDTGNLSVSDVFTLTVTNVNEAPTVSTALEDQQATEDALFNFVLPADTFADVDPADALTYGATLADGSPLPTWLSFNTATRTFSGTPGPGDAGSLQIAVTATDTHPASVTDQFALTVSGPLPLSLIGTSGNDILTGGRGDDTLSGLAGNDSLNGGEGHDLLDGGTGIDQMAGGIGNDTYVVESFFDGVTEAANEGTDTVQSALLAYTLGANIENLTLTGTGPSAGIGNALNNVLTGNSGANLLDGKGGTDQMAGGAGDDLYVVDHAGDTVVEQAGEGTLDSVTSSVSYSLSANVENLVLTGSAAISGIGNDQDNVLTGNSAVNALTGLSGNDTYLIGGGDTVVEASGGGTDTVESLLSYTLGANVENLTLTGLLSISGTGNSLNNTITGNNANNTLTGANGNDTLRGGLGNDTVNGGGGNDTFLFGRGEGQDLIQDNSGTADRLLYDAGINPLDLVISRQANDLRLAIHGSSDRITVQNWYVGTTNRTETIQAGNGQTLLSTQVDQLIQAMASFSQQSGLTWDQAIDQRPQDVQAVLAASWQ